METRIQDLINTDERKKIFQAMLTLHSDFTSKELQHALLNEGLNIRITTVQNLLRGLCYRGYLIQSNIKLGTTRGRSTLHFKKAVQ